MTVTFRCTKCDQEFTWENCSSAGNMGSDGPSWSLCMECKPIETEEDIIAAIESFINPPIETGVDK